MKNVLVDIDDTLAATVSGILDYVRAQSVHSFTMDDLTRESREKRGNAFDVWAKKFLANPGLVNSVIPYEGAKQALARLHDAGYTVHIASSRRENLHQITLQWLEIHGFANYISHIHCRQSQNRGVDFKKKIIKKVKPVAVFDDTYEIAEALAGENLTVYLISKPWNAEETLPPNIVRSKDFIDAVGQFLESDSLN